MKITRKQIMKKYESMKKSDKTAFIMALSYNSSSAFKSYFGNLNLSDEEISNRDKLGLEKFFGSKDAVIKAFMEIEEIVEESIDEKLNFLISYTSKLNNEDELKKFKKVYQTLCNIVDTKLDLIRRE